MIEKKTVFISHANPDDNLFSRWFSLQLIKLGYNVWCDVINLKGGEDFWNEIENEIRNKTIIFIYVLSKVSNSKEGPKKELAVAEKVKKALNNSDFIIPIIIDNISYDSINIELNRINAINFHDYGWADGMKKLTEKFNEVNVPKNEHNLETIKEYWESTYIRGNQILESEEIYLSNWFPIISLPEKLHFHNFKGMIDNDFDLNKLEFPASDYKGRLVSFARHNDFITDLPKTIDYDSQNSHIMKVKEILDNTFTNSFIPQKDAKRILIALLNSGFKKNMVNRNLNVYNLSNERSAYWYPIEFLDKNKYNGELLIGKQKDKKWHFAISGFAKLYPLSCFGFASHIIFSFDGKEVIPSDSAQHKARRRQGRNWWNDKWRDKILAFAGSISNNEGNIEIVLGSDAKLIIASKPVEFISPVNYIQPSRTRENIEDNWFEDDESQ